MSGGLEPEEASELELEQDDPEYRAVFPGRRLVLSHWNASLVPAGQLARVLAARIDKLRRWPI